MNADIESGTSFWWPLQRWQPHFSLNTWDYSSVWKVDVLYEPERNPAAFNSVHSLSPPPFVNLSWSESQRMLEPFPAVKNSDTARTGCKSMTGQTPHTYSWEQFRVPSQIMCLSLDCGRKLVYPQNNPCRHGGKHTSFIQKPNPGPTLRWADNDNNSTSVPQFH